MALIGFLLIAVSVPSNARSEEEAKPAPRILLTVPLTVERGQSATIALRGLQLDTTNEVRIVDGHGISASIKAKGKTNVPNGLKAENVGDTQVEVELTVPTEFTEPDLQIVAVTDAGQTEPIRLSVAAEGTLVVDREPNGGFEQAQSVTVGQTIVGVIHENRNVDVFRISGSAGQAIELIVEASSFGSPLDSTLTLFDERGRLLAYVDDVDGSRDARLRATIPGSGDLIVAVADALDTGSPLHVYRLLVRAASEQQGD